MASQVLLAHGRFCAVHLDQLSHDDRPVVGAVRRRGFVHLTEERQVGLVGRHVIEHVRHRAAFWEWTEVGPHRHNFPNEVGASDGNLQGDDRAVAPSDEMGGTVDDRLDEGDGVIGHVLTGERSYDVWRVPVAATLGKEEAVPRREIGSLGFPGRVRAEAAVQEE